VSESAGSRIEAARRRTAATKRSLGTAAVAGFLAVLGLAYASHHGSSSAAGVGGGLDGDEDAFVELDDGLEFGSFGSVAPSGGAPPQVRGGES
jgi:hypothetical protein